MKPITPDEHPDEPRPVGETERDNDALRPTDPKQRKGAASDESTAQKTAKQQTDSQQSQTKP